MEQTRIRIPPLPREEWTEAARDVFDVFGTPGARENGSKVNNNLVLANHPPLGLAVYGFGKHFLFHSTLPPWSARSRRCASLGACARSMNGIAMSAMR